MNRPLSDIAADEQNVRGALKAVRDKIRRAEGELNSAKEQEAQLLKQIDDLSIQAAGAFERTRSAGLPEAAKVEVDVVEGELAGVQF